jgi:hypothetical protein
MTRIEHNGGPPLSFTERMIGQGYYVCQHCSAGNYIEPGKYTPPEKDAPPPKPAEPKPSAASSHIAQSGAATHRAVAAALG